MSGLETAAALATVIGIVASPLFQTFLESFKNHLKRTSSKFHLILPQPTLLPSDLLALEEAMGNIQGFLQLSQRIDNRIGDLPKILTQLRKAAYAAEDLLDELDYQDLKLMVEADSSRAEAHSNTSQVGRFTQLKMFFTACFAQMKVFFTECFSRCCITAKASVTAERIRSTVEDLNRVASRLKDIYPLISEFSRTTGTMVTRSRVTTSTVTSSRVYGRDENKKEIMDILQTELIHDKEPRVSIIAIVGVGGVGKTTLAQYVFNDDKLRTLFDFKVWICVSDEYRKEKIIREMIMDTASSRDKTSIELQSITSLDTLERMLKNNVENKRLLLVLDDVWSDQWTEILLPLQNTVKLCKILVTTREEKNVKLPVAVAHCKSKICVLEGLDDAVYQSLFDEHAFGIQGPSGHPKGSMLQPIGWQIAKKLKGSPLAAKTVGAVLRERLDVEHWRRVQDSDLWSIGNQMSGDIMPALMLSYLHLPTSLQRCFSYCAILPKDYKIQKEDLVNMWIAQSYVSCSRHDERPKDAGLHHFEDLVSRSFFTYYKESYPSCYKMHDLLHDLALFVSLKECCVFHSENWRGDPETCHHLSITESQKLPGNLTEHLLKSVKLQLEHARTLTIDSFEKAPEILKSMKRVRVLKCISEIDLENEVSLHDIGHLIHLRYLDLSRIEISNMSESICTLYHLQTLLFNPDVEIRFPKGMCNLVNLCHLVADSPSIAKIPFIGKLSQLQELQDFNCEYNNIGQLKEMNELGGKLRIMKMESVASIHDAENASLCKKRRLKKLKLKWGYNTIYNAALAEHHDTVLQFLQPNEQLEMLKISGHPGCKSPSWIAPSSLRYIQRIHLYNCSHWHSLSGIAQLPYLQCLRMKGMRLVIELGDKDVFPSLEEMYLRDVSLSFKKSQVHGMMFPQLQIMYLIDCETLEGLTMPSSLTNLTIKRSDFELPAFLKGSSLISLKISHQYRFTSFDREVMDSLSSLEDLSMKDIRLVIELGDEDAFPSLVEIYLRDVSLSFKKSHVHGRMFPKLQKMCLIDCEKLEGLTMPSSLKALKIEKCDIELPAFLKGLSSLTTLEIRNQDRFTSFDREVMDSLSSLKRLGISSCNNFQSFSENGFPGSLEMLVVVQCSRELHAKLEDPKSPEWSMVQHIPYRNISQLADDDEEWTL